MTDAEYDAWRNNPSNPRLLLVEVDVRVSGSETTRYLSTDTYITSTADSPASLAYQAIVSKDLTVTEQLPLSGEASMALGEIELNNTAHTRDSWLTDIWENRGCRIYLGDPRWPRSDFRQVFSGTNADITGTKDRSKLSIRIRDKLQRLNTAVTETKLGGTTDNKDSLLPLGFGDNHNVTPLLVDNATHKYMLHNGTIAEIDEVRDNGQPVGFTPTLSTGTFVLTQAPYGAITASFRGDATGSYVNTVAGVVQRLVTSYGKAVDRFVTGDLDTTQLAAFDTAHPDPIGLVLTDRVNVLNAIRDVAASIGAQVVMTKLGKMRLVQINLPAVGTATQITPAHMLLQDIKIASRTDVVAAVKLGFNKNWTVQKDLTTWISDEDKMFFGQEWLTTTKVDATTATNYRLETDPAQKDTLLVRRVEADVEAQRLLDLNKVVRQVYQVTCFLAMSHLELGDTATITHPYFGLAAGKTGMVVSLATTWARNRVVVGVLI